MPFVQPCPEHLTEKLTLRDGSRVTIRPIRPEDAEIEQAFVRGLPHESRYFRFTQHVCELSPQMLQHFTQVDYRLHLGLVAISDAGGRPVQVAVARYVADATACSAASSPSSSLTNGNPLAWAPA